MKARAMYLWFLSIALWAGWATAASFRQEPAPSPAGSGHEQTQPPSADSRGEPPANPPQETSPAAPPVAPEQGPPEQQPPAQPEIPPQQAPQARPPGEPASPPPKPPVLRHRKPKAAAKSAQPSPQTGADPAPGNPNPNKVVVRNGGARDNSGQIEPGVNTATAEQQRASTARLLAAADANLKRAEARQLTKAEQSTMQEIRSYMRQAKAASDQGDTSRAETLAYKARLLSDELAGK